MLLTEREKLGRDITAFANQYGNERSALISILQEVQRKYSHVSDYAMQVIADTLDIHPVEVYSVVSFYQFLSNKPKGRFVIQLSDCISHDSDEKAAVSRQLENDLGIKFGQSTTDGNYTLEWTGCIGMCDQGPVVSVNGRIYTQFTADKVDDVLEECRTNVSGFGDGSKEGGR